MAISSGSCLPTNRADPVQSHSRFRRLPGHRQASAVKSSEIMALVAGTKLGPYEILAPIGAGGMGEVYRARDSRLDRIVAIKVTKDQFSERFEREARAVAALNHPRICQIYDIGP